MKYQVFFVEKSLIHRVELQKAENMHVSLVYRIGFWRNREQRVYTELPNFSKADSYRIRAKN